MLYVFDEKEDDVITIKWREKYKKEYFKNKDIGKGHSYAQYLMAISEELYIFDDIAKTIQEWDKEYEMTH